MGQMLRDRGALHRLEFPHRPRSGGTQPLASVAGHHIDTVLATIGAGSAVVTAFNQGPIGFTCHYVGVLSHHPPLITFTPSKNSLTWPQIRQSGTFCLNLFDNADGEPEILSRFASLAIDRFEGIPWTTGPLGSPVLAGVSAWIECTIWAEHEGGDHKVIIGEVRGLGSNVLDLPPLMLQNSYS